MNRKNIIYTIILAVAIIFSYFAALPQSVIISIIMLIGGFFLLIKGADYFVDGSSSLAAKMRSPRLSWVLRLLPWVQAHLSWR